MSDLQERLDRAERALTRAGFTMLEGAQEWKPPLGPSASPLLDRIDQLNDQLDNERTEKIMEFRQKYRMAELLREAKESVYFRLESPDSGLSGEEAGKLIVLTERIADALAGKLPERPDTEWTDGASSPTEQDYRELQDQHDQLQSKYKAAMDTLGSAVKTAEFEGHAHRPWHDSAKTLLAGQVIAHAVPAGWQLVPANPTPETTWGYMLAAAPKPEGAA